MASRPSPDPSFILRGANSAVTCLAYPSSDILYSGTLDGRVLQWSLNNRRVGSMLNAHSEQSVLWVWTDSEGRLLTQGRDGLVKSWHCSDGMWKNTSNFRCATLGFCASTVVSVNNKQLIASPSDVTSQVNLYDIHNNCHVMTLKPDCGHQKIGMCMSIKSISNQSADSDMSIRSSTCQSADSNDISIKSPNNQSAKNNDMSVKSRTNQSAENNDMSIKSTTNQSAEGPHILVGYESGSILLWDLRTGKCVSYLHGAHNESVMCMAFSSRSMKGVSGSVNNNILSWTVDSQYCIEKQGETVMTNPGLNDIVIRADDKLLACAGWDNNIRLYGFKKMKPLAVLSYHRESAQCLAFSPDNMLACGSKDQLISVWDIYR